MFANLKLDLRFANNKTLTKRGSLTDMPVENLNVIYAGEESLKTKHGNLISFPHSF